MPYVVSHLNYGVRPPVFYMFLYILFLPSPFIAHVMLCYATRHCEKPHGCSVKWTNDSIHILYLVSCDMAKMSMTSNDVRWPPMVIAEVARAPLREGETLLFLPFETIAILFASISPKVLQISLRNFRRVLGCQFNPIPGVLKGSESAGGWSLCPPPVRARKPRIVATNGKQHVR